MIFRWLKRRKRRGLAAAPFPHAWEDYLYTNVPRFAELNPLAQDEIQNAIKISVAEKNWEGCGGLKMTEEIKVTISAQIAMFVLGLGGEQFDRVLSILVYPSAYLAEENAPLSGNFTLRRKSARAGEAWYRGPVVLNWEDVLADSLGQRPGHNLVIHEFAHQLDMLNGGDCDGVPQLPGKLVQPWVNQLENEYERLCEACRYGGATAFDCYGTTNHAEFFAVASEAFFENSEAFQDYHPELFHLFREFYHQRF